MNKDELKTKLDPMTYHVTQEKGTEPAFTGKYWDEHADGTYYCVVCGQKLFESDTKFDSGTGWPSFWAPISPDAIKTDTDSTFGMTRTEVLSKAGGHLGHVFNDGPEPTGLRYCINGDALKFIPDEEEK